MMQVQLSIVSTSLSFYLSRYECMRERRKSDGGEREKREGGRKGGYERRNERGHARERVRARAKDRERALERSSGRFDVWRIEFDVGRIVV